MRSELIHKIFGAGNHQPEALIMEVFRYQYEHNTVYRQFCSAVRRNPMQVGKITEIPFLPIRFFKTHEVITGTFIPETWFESSGTTGMVNSRHQVRSLALYRESFTRAFELHYGDPGEWCVLGLLPAYLERQHSSLVVMVDELIKMTGHPQSGFYLYDYDRLRDTLTDLESRGQRTLLIGVTFALLDFAARFPMPLRHTTIMETGGMKGRRKEITRAELHEQLGLAFNSPPIHSEYGMTELLSQAYSTDNGIFYPPPWLRVLFRDEDDPFALSSTSEWQPGGGTRRVKNGVINVIDLANIDSCCFIATDDMGRMHPDGGFEVLGRIDNADIRGCSLMTV